MTRPPRLETERLVLRGWQGSDFQAHAAMAADPEAMRYVGGVRDREQAWRQLAVQAGHWVLRGYGNWAVDRKEDGLLLGRVGLWNPEGWPGLEIGWQLARHAWGRGYATEAARVALEWAWTELPVDRLLSVIERGNTASVRVAERLGMAPDGQTTISGKPVTIYAIERPGGGGATARA